jgi:hypothetical protein
MKKQLVSAVAALMLAAISTQAVAATEWVIIERPKPRPQGQHCETPYEKYYIDGLWRPIGDRCSVYGIRGRITK